MIGTILVWYRAVSGFVVVYKWIVAGVAILGFATTVFIYIDNHGEMKSTIKGQDRRIGQLLSDNGGLDATIEARNATIAKQNRVMSELIAANKKRVVEANKAVINLRRDRAVLTTELGILRFNTLEAIRDDETFADWADWTVPSISWGLLNIAEYGFYGTPSTDMP